MTLQGTVRWGANELALVDSSHALKDLIPRLEDDAKSRPVMVDVIANDGRSLTLGLGRDKAVLSLAGPRGAPLRARREVDLALLSKREAAPGLVTGRIEGL
jgi:hypothetical protein